jgi:hypothetical protein
MRLEGVSVSEIGKTVAVSYRREKQESGYHGHPMTQNILPSGIRSRQDRSHP